MNDERSELQADVQQPVGDRQPWQRPTLKRLQVNLDTASSFSGDVDGGNDFETASA